MEKEVNIFQKYKESIFHKELSVKTFNAVKQIYEYRDNYKLLVNDFDRVAILVQKIYGFIFLIAILVWIYAYKNLDPLYSPLIVILLWLILRGILNATHQKAMFLSKEAKDWISTSKLQEQCIELKFKNEAMENFMKSQIFNP